MAGLVPMPKQRRNKGNLCPKTEKSIDNSGHSRKRKRTKTTSVVDLNSGASTSNNIRVENIAPYENSIGQASYQRGRCGTISEYLDIGDMTHVCSDCNALFWLSESKKNASKKNPPIYTKCCREGRIKLQTPHATPLFLQNMFDSSNGRQSILFRENIRAYNSMFAFTSIGAKIDQTINDGSGPYVFKISGQVHHLMGSLLPLENESPKFAQLYI